MVQRQQTTQTLFPDAMEARYEMDLKTVNRGIRELTCECDPGLRPYAVSLRNLDTWEVRPGPLATGPSYLHLRLKEAIHEGTLRVSCLAPLRQAGTAGDGLTAWSSPGLRVLEAVPRGETLVLRLHPDLGLEGWHPGSFRLTETTSENDPDDPVAWQRLTLVGGGITPEGKQPARPGARLQVHPVQYRARQLAWWQPTLARARLTLQIQYDVSAGQLFQLPVQLPAGWDFEQADVSPAGLYSTAQVRHDKDRTLLVVELTQPLTSAPLPETVRDLTSPALLRGSGSGTLTIQLGMNTGQASGRRVLAFPDAVPLGARLREGVLAIEVDAALQRGEVKTTAVPGDVQEEGPWGRHSPTFYFPYRDKPPQGSLTLVPRAPVLGARCSTDVTLAGDRATLQTEIALEVEAGPPLRCRCSWLGKGCRAGPGVPPRPVPRLSAPSAWSPGRQPARPTPWRLSAPVPSRWHC